MDDGPAEGLDPAVAAIVAHGLLNAATKARAAIGTLRAHGSRLAEDERARLLAGAEEHVVFISDCLADLVRGLPAEVHTALENLSDRSGPGGSGRH